MFVGDDAASVSGEHSPQQARKGPCDEARRQGKREIRGEGCDCVRDKESQDARDQQGLASRATGQCNRGDGCQDCAESVDAHELSRRALGDVEAGRDLRQQASWHGFGGDDDESGQGHHQKGCPG